MVHPTGWIMPLRRLHRSSARASTRTQTSGEASLITRQSSRIAQAPGVRIGTGRLSPADSALTQGLYSSDSIVACAAAIRLLAVVVSGRPLNCIARTGGGRVTG